MTLSTEQFPALAIAEPVTVAARAAAPIAALATGRHWTDLPAGNLDQAQLRELTASIAARPELWRAHVGFDTTQRHYASLYRDEYVDIWLLCWTPDNDTGWHDHDVSSGAVAVVDGRLVERNLTLGGPGVATDVEAGRVFSFGPDHIHRLSGRDPGSVSVHAYSPPLVRLGQYAVTSGGVLHRTTVSYTEELRPS